MSRLRAKSSDLLDVLAAEKRDVLVSRLKHETIAKFAVELTKYLLGNRMKGRKLWPNGEDEEILKEQTETALASGIELAVWLKALVDAGKRMYGDPQEMYESKAHLHHAVPYWNPTAHRLNIHALGLIVPPKQGEKLTPGNIQFQDWVEPGELVYIPYPDTTGGKYSSVAGVAPQLRPCPRDVDDFLDLAPTTYAEWCTYQEGGVLSSCCGKMMVWSDQYHRLICSRCGERCTGN